MGTAQRTIDLAGQVTADLVVEMRQKWQVSRMLDVRMTAEFRAGDVGLPIIAVCRSGPRAERAAAMLRGAGLEEVYGMEGGMRAWQLTGFPTESLADGLDAARQSRLA